MLCQLRYVFIDWHIMADGKNFLSCFVFRYPRHPILYTYITYICSRSYSKSFGERFFSCQCQQRYYLDTCCATVTATYKPKMQCGLVLLVVTDSLFECKKSQRRAAKKDQGFLTDQLYFFLLNLPESINLISKVCGRRSRSAPLVQFNRSCIARCTIRTQYCNGLYKLHYFMSLNSITKSTHTHCFLHSSSPNFFIFNQKGGPSI